MGNDYANMVSRGDDGNRALYRSVNDTGFSRDVDDYGVPLPSNGETLRDWPYRQIIESIDVPMSLFDAGQIPYPHQDKEFDYLLCFQAIEHYCHPRDWMKVVDEFCRITKESVIILLNPKLDWLQADDESYDSDFAQAKLALRNYDRNGFRCTSCHIQWGTVHGFKLTANPAG
jgi:SAM-dependent methyltransferase